MVLAAGALAKDAQTVTLDVGGERTQGALNRNLRAGDLQQPLTLTNAGENQVQAVVTVSGAPLVPEPAAERGFKIERTTYANITFFLPILIIRKLMQLTGIKTESENNINVSAFNGLLGRIFGAERLVLQRMNLPFGVSGLCVARAAD